MPKFLSSAPKKPWFIPFQSTPHKQYNVAKWVAQQSVIEPELNFLNKNVAWEAFLRLMLGNVVYQLLEWHNII